MARSIVWLASYPKSGNTWLRAMLTHLLDAPGEDFSLDALAGGPEGGDRHALDDACGISSAEMGAAELLPYRAMLHRQMAASAQAPFFVKTHDLYAVEPDGTALFPADASRAAVYIVRDPRDVALSFAHHSRWDVDRTIARMGDRQATLNVWPDRISDFLPVRLGSWSKHVESWTEQNAIPVCLLRYEDMLADPAAALAKVVAIAGIDAAPAAIAAAAAASGFDALRAREAAEGFREKPPGLPDFFRSGRAGEGAKALTPAQIARIVADHGDLMAALGYRPGPPA
ncbi:MAG TPA: sulfotransferase domain-containing protein [Sphingopyxis sp.]|nr:sulfotransferase domain-containing protein [Sphingopyxis sp.]HMP45948.1 sulfotransferase domain-containing protein [Sphingopyxis sp.]HMQ17883.1 sulfotransferase domain-containing protein [Sphingopyxis sp.]